jgi:SAM-dependent methyltransferase
VHRENRRKEMSGEKEYILGTHDEEIERLGLQHRVWRPWALDAWRRAGFTTGQTLLDVGCGPGYATHDLADIVGPSGHVHAVDRSRRFLDTLAADCTRGHRAQVTLHELDLDDEGLPEVGADGAWVRWVFSFVRRPRPLLERLRESLLPGGVLVMHEYLDYGAWRVLPRSQEFEAFVRTVMTSWRAEGGEPDIAASLPVWLGELGFALHSLRPIVEVVPATNYFWQWPKAFIRVNLRRLVELKRLSEEEAAAVVRILDARENTPHAFMVTPVVLEMIAVRR